MTTNEPAYCPFFFASHGCDLPPGHAGNHECHHEDEGEEPRIFDWKPGKEGEFE